MRRAMVVMLFLVLLTSAAGAAWWDRYQGTMTWSSHLITNRPGRISDEFYVLLCYSTTPWSIRIEQVGGGWLFSGEFDKEGKTLQFRASELAGETVVGHGSFNATETALNFQGWGFVRVLPGRSFFKQYRFRGRYVNTIWRP